MKHLNDFRLNESTRVENKYLGTGHTGVDVKLTSDKISGQLSDTKIEISAGTLCWVSGDSIDEFMKELQNIIDKYAI